MQCEVSELPFEMQPRHIRKAIRQEALKKGMPMEHAAWLHKADGDSASPHSADATPSLPFNHGNSAEPSSAGIRQHSPIEDFDQPEQPLSGPSGPSKLDPQVGMFDPSIMGGSSRHYASPSPPVFGPSDAGAFRGDGAPALHPYSHAPHEHSSVAGRSLVDPQLEFFAAQNATHEVDESVEDMFGSLTNGGEGNEVEFRKDEY